MISVGALTLGTRYIAPPYRSVSFLLPTRIHGFTAIAQNVITYSSTQTHNITRQQQHRIFQSGLPLQLLIPERGHVYESRSRDRTEESAGHECRESISMAGEQGEFSDGGIGSVVFEVSLPEHECC
jgi:hypothetical protein